MYSNEKEIVNDIFRLTLAPSPHFEFSQFLIVDQKTCLIHAGKAVLFENLKKMVQNKLNGRKLDYIVFSHVEADESGAVNEWLEVYPEAVVVCNKVANINLQDFLIRPAKVINDGDHISLGSRSLQLVNTPHFPHNWDAHMWFEPNNKVLFSSDFCCQGGNCIPTTEDDISSKIIDFYVNGGFIPYGKTTNEAVEKLMNLPIEILAPMHGSVIVGDVCHEILSKVSKDLISRSI